MTIQVDSNEHLTWANKRSLHLIFILKQTIEGMDQSEAIDFLMLKLRSSVLSCKCASSKNRISFSQVKHRNNEIYAFVNDLSWML